jgi:O-antigen/teichoic acid export membrane protein
VTASASTDGAADTVTVSRNSVTVGAGLILLGVSATVYLVLSARAVGPREFASLSTLWTLVYTFGIGAFLPFEQELGRAVARRTVLGQGAGPVVARTAAIAGVVLVTLLVALAVAAPLFVDRLFAGQSTPLVALAVAMVAMAAQYLTRGLFSGTGRFGWYSAQLGLEGLVRIGGCVALLIAGVHTAGPYAWVLAAAPMAALLLTVPGAGQGVRSGPSARWAEVSVNLGWLLISAICAQAVANAAMVALQLLAPHSDTAGKFLAAFVIARIPLFLFQAVQATLIPGLARALAARDHAGFRRELGRVLVVTGLVGVAGMAGAAVLGPWALQLAFGKAFDLGRADIVVLAVSTGLYMLALVFQAGLVAMERHRANAAGWSIALGSFAAMCLVPLPALVRVETALVLSCGVAVGLLGMSLFRATRLTLAAEAPVGHC